MTAWRRALAGGLLLQTACGGWVFGGSGGHCNSACSGHGDGACLGIPLVETEAKVRYIFSLVGQSCPAVRFNQNNMNPSLWAGDCYTNTGPTTICGSTFPDARRMCCCGPACSCPLSADDQPCATETSTTVTVSTTTRTETTTASSTTSTTSCTSTTSTSSTSSSSSSSTTATTSSTSSSRTTTSFSSSSSSTSTSTSTASSTSTTSTSSSTSLTSSTTVTSTSSSSSSSSATSSTGSSSTSRSSSSSSSTSFSTSTSTSDSTSSSSSSTTSRSTSSSSSSTSTSRSTSTTSSSSSSSSSVSTTWSSTTSSTSSSTSTSSISSTTSSSSSSYSSSSSTSVSTTGSSTTSSSRTTRTSTATRTVTATDTGTTRSSSSTTSSSSISGTSTTSSSSSETSSRTTLSSTWSSSSSTSSSSSRSLTASATGTSTPTSTATTSSATDTESTSTLSTATKTSTTTSEVSAQEKVEELLEAVEEIEASVLSSLVESNKSLDTLSSPVSVTAAARLSDLLLQRLAVRDNGTAQVPAEEEKVPSVVVPVAGTDVEVAVPVTVFQDVAADPGESVVMMVTVFNGSSFSGPQSPSSPSVEEETQTPVITVTAVVSIDFLALMGNKSRTLAVGDLSNAIEFSMPANYTSGTHCAFWDEALGDWSTEGVSVSGKSVPGGLLWCLTTHLSLFGAIWQSFLLTLDCSQVSLLSPETIANILRGNWYQYLGSIIVWMLMAIFSLLCCVSAILDRRDAWRPEFFLMPRGETPEERELRSAWAAECDLNFAAEATATESLRISLRGRLSQISTATAGGDFRPIASGLTVASGVSAASSMEGSGHRSLTLQCITGCVAIANYTMGNSAVRDAMQDIVTAWCKQLGIIEGVCEQVWQVASFGPTSLSTASVSSAKLVVACRRALQSIALLSAQRQAAARMALSSDMVVHVLEDPDLYRLLAKFREREPTSRHDIYVEETGEAEWAALHEKVTEKVLEELDLQKDRYILSMAMTLFFANNPFTSVLIFDPFYDRKLRTFLFVVDQALTIMVMCCFFEASGEAGGGRRGRFGGGGGCGDAGHKVLAEMSGYRIGRFMAIALVSAGISTIPVFFLESLQTRGMVSVKHKGCPKWEKQLRIWRVQDLMIYGVGTALFLFAVFFINLFLANGSAKDHEDWLIGVSLVLLQDWIALPFSVALALPLTCRLLLAFVRRAAKTDMPALVREQRVALLRETNAMLPLMGV